MAGRRKQVKLSKKELKYRTRLELQGKPAETPVEDAKSVVKKVITIPQVVPVRYLAELASVPVTAIIQALFKNGVMVTINESIDFETAVLIGDDLGLELVSETENKNQKESTALNQKTRPPVVTIMGHVDHGKTQLLDAIRQTDVVSTESGGITQHIGAYQIETEYEKKKRAITFLDTPGHEAFSALRAHGANLTDIVVLVVAADDSVKAQTIEAISHAKAAQVPIIVAINKIDLPNSDPDRVKRDLATHNLLAEDWGGKTPMVQVSAKEKTNIKQLLEMILLVSDLLDLKATLEGNALGTVIESHVEVGVGTLATVLVEQGTLKVGQILVIGHTLGKIRFMEDWKGKRISEATPSAPVQIAGIRGIPAFGDRFEVTADEKTAKNMLSEIKEPGVVRSVNNQITSTNEFNIIIKADVVGSLQAIKTALYDIPSDKVTIKTLSEGIGNITESDVNLALTSGGYIFGFRVSATKAVELQAKRDNIEIKLYDTIYKLIEELYQTIEGQISPEISQDVIGQLKVLKVFFQTNEEAIIGGKVISGKLGSKIKAKIIREEVVIGEGKITNLKIGPTEVDEVGKNDECGLQIIKQTKSEDGYKIKEDDIIETYLITQKQTKLTKEDK